MIFWFGAVVVGALVVMFMLLRRASESNLDEVNERMDRKLREEISTDEYAMVRGWCEDSDSVCSHVKKLKDEQGYITVEDFTVLSSMMGSREKDHVRQLVWDEVDGRS